MDAEYDLRYPIVATRLHPNRLPRMPSTFKRSQALHRLEKDSDDEYRYGESSRTEVDTLDAGNGIWPSTTPLNLTNVDFAHEAPEIP